MTRLCDHFAVTSRLRRSHFAVINDSKSGFSITSQLFRGFVAQLRSKTDNLDIVAVLISLLFQNRFILPQIGFQIDSIKRQNVSIMLHVCYEKKIGVKPSNSRNETGQYRNETGNNRNEAK